MYKPGSIQDRCQSGLFLATIKHIPPLARHRASLLTQGEWYIERGVQILQQTILTTRLAIFFSEIHNVHDSKRIIIIFTHKGHRVAKLAVGRALMATCSSHRFAPLTIFLGVSAPCAEVMGFTKMVNVWDMRDVLLGRFGTKRCLCFTNVTSVLDLPNVWRSSHARLTRRAITV